ncbi:MULTISPECIES: divergent polysaccharide deacetylase family protein [unclassified Mesorhizobium]|uniref:divergent polysaccharide deacetylase family protein n=1 Tax=unclassified Mesorhizobium TaxID=325217 RepID=UPI000FC9A3AB|nr:MULTISPECIES: divergent polysaccharide deacetylase family protein [unclassified Mesorhizobium]RUX70583.1 divergent polysaccharide deacetylase family protein [Mesorhizobium sp. M7A.F.Ca.US.005.03.1.1]RUY11270.1 divergent polysaccharide deacetylase family protein [Mesorhizobium sp. M7A.F.Ca.US.005.03.2.1]RUY43162.1 divergent polysaccharide deacetylase family protein [Mesorhizobium sp. M7A.F.Ca.US.001.04.1.1]RVA01572.1 divergent polysaccharide deacetylase family protein [Mesorhizobium sp. M7A.F
MTDIGKDIERPLGQAVRPPRAAGKLSGGAIMATVAVLVVAGISGAIALREKPFRKPQEVAVSTLKVTAAAEPAAAPPALAPAAPKPEAPVKSGGPQIIHVQTEEGDGPPKAAIVIRDPSTVGQNLKVAHIPDKALIEASETGPLPVRAADGRRPFDVYARPWSGGRGARVAIVIGGLSVSQTGTQAAIAKLPAEVTLAFAPQGNSIGRWMQAARQSGHEIVMQVPLEPFDYPKVNPGRNTLTVAASADENLKSLHWALSRTTNYTGVMNYMGARFSADAAAMEPFIAELGKRGLAYIDDGSSARSLAPDLALKDGVPFVAGDMAIDAVQDRGEILKKLDSLEATARAKGTAVGIGSAFDLTVDTVSSWVVEAKKRGIEIVPISAVAIDPQKG